MSSRERLLQEARARRISERGGLRGESHAADPVEVAVRDAWRAQSGQDAL